MPSYVQNGRMNDLKSPTSNRGHRLTTYRQLGEISDLVASLPMPKSTINERRRAARGIDRYVKDEVEVWMLQGGTTLDIDHIMSPSEGTHERRMPYLSENMRQSGWKRGITPDRALRIVIFSFELLIEHMDRVDHPYQPVLYIPLEDSPNKVGHPPASPAEVLDSVHFMGSPGVALIPWANSRKTPPLYTGFSTDVPFTIFDRPGVRATYREEPCLGEWARWIHAGYIPSVACTSPGLFRI
jgi:hypothetical protein